MLRVAEPGNTAVIVLVLLVAAAVVGAGMEAPANGSLPQAMGSSGAVFAGALGGIRSAAAAYLWIKLDSAHHEYYGGDLGKERPLMPLFRIATWLDPRLERAYYVGSYMLWRYGKEQAALDFAQEGARKNPDSVMLRMNLGQLYLSGEGNVAKREALRNLLAAERMNRGEEDVFRFQLIGSLDAAYKKWRISGEPASIISELGRLRALSRQGKLKVPPEIRDDD